MNLSATRVMDVVFPGETNHHGTLFGGISLAIMDKAANISAARHGQREFVTASCEKIDFTAPARLGDIVEATGTVILAARYICHRIFKRADIGRVAFTVTGIWVTITVLFLGLSLFITGPDILQFGLVGAIAGPILGSYAFLSQHT